MTSSYHLVPRRQMGEDGDEHAIEMTYNRARSSPRPIMDRGRWSFVSTNPPAEDEACVRDDSSRASLISTTLPPSNDSETNEQKPSNSEDVPHPAAADYDTLRQNSRRTEFGVLQKLSPTTSAMLLLSLIAVLGATAYLGFLWSFPNGTQRNHAWLMIVLNERALISITISAVVLRTAVSVQAIISTSMLASIILEHRGVQLHSLASVAPLRFVNNGPLSLLLATRSMLTRLDPWLGAAFLLYCTTLVLQFTSTILLSDIKTGTLMGEVMLNATYTGMSFQNLNQTAARKNNPRQYWMEPVNSFPAFAQYHEDYSSQDDYDTGDLSIAVVDTGLTHRAFLPFAGEDQRTSISSFGGTATILDSRVVCARPRMHSNYTITLRGRLPIGQGTKTLDRWFLSGAISVDPAASPPGLIRAHDPVTLALEGRETPQYVLGDGDDRVFVPLDHQDYILFGNSPTEWIVAQFGIAEGPRLLSSLDPRYTDIVGSLHPDIFNVTSNQTGGETAWYEPAFYLRDDKVPLMTGRAYQLMNVTPAESYPTVANQDIKDFGNQPGGLIGGVLFHPDPTLPDLGGRAEKLNISAENEWLVFTMPSVPGWRIATTLCFDSFVSVDVNVTLSTTSIVNEPRLTTWNSSTRRFGTEAVRQQLIEHQLPVDDIDHDTESHPLILETTPIQLREQISILYQDSKSRGLEHIAFPSQAFIQNAISSWKESGTIFCNDCHLNIRTDSDSANFLPGVEDPFEPYLVQYYFQNNSRLHNDIFQDVIQNTNSTVGALQTYYTIIARQAYYDLLPYFDIADKSLVSQFTNVPFPRTSRGLIAVAIILIVHIAMVLVITLCFITKTKVSLLGNNAWQTLAQSTSDDVSEIVGGMTMSTDNEVKELLKSTGTGRDVFTLRWTGGTPNKTVKLKKV